jgi:Flp pilus assembly protein TadG
MKRRSSNERGQAMVEFTLIAMVLATLLLAVFQFGVTFSNYISVADAARAAARKAATQGAGPTYDPTLVTASRALAISSAEGSTGNTCAAKSWCTTIKALSNNDNNWIAGNPVSATETAPYAISILGFKVFSGTLSHTVTMRIENKNT